MPYWTEQPHWLAVAQDLIPELRPESVRPARVVRVEADPSAFQGWRVEAAPHTVAEAQAAALACGDSFILDFGQHLVGRLSFRMTLAEGLHDAPVRVRLTLAEVPAELMEPAENAKGGLSTSWIQDETVTVDELPAPIALPRRYAFRYVKVDVVAMSTAYRIRLEDFACETVSSAGLDVTPRLPAHLAGDDRAIATASLRTLRDCMQTVFEDGPKRDRRLWIGDLRLQALANAASYRRFDLVKRCIYLFAGVARDSDGMVPGCLYERPAPMYGGCHAMDYMGIYGVTLAEYVDASGDMETGRELLPVAIRQLDLLLALRDADGMYTPKVWWFIDWCEGLDKQPAVHGVIIWCLRHICALAARLGMADTTAHLEALLPRLRTMARAAFVEGRTVPTAAHGQVSWASWAWLTLAEVLTPEEASAAFDLLSEMKDVIRPGGPYLTHYILEALWLLGRRDDALATLRAYWKPMLDAGLDTCPEIWDIADDKRSPYGSHLLNSYCHAWSCTPIWFFAHSR